MRRIIVAIIDNKANDIVPQTMVWIHKHSATAVRMYIDAVSDTRGQMFHHLEDYDLVQLGELDDNNLINPSYEIIMTGKAYKASIKPEEPTQPQIRPIGAK